jgi:hypothetical protein
LRRHRRAPEGADLLITAVRLGVKGGFAHQIVTEPGRVNEFGEFFKVAKWKVKDGESTIKMLLIICVVLPFV